MRNKTFSSARDMIENRKLLKEPEYYRDMLNLSIERGFVRNICRPHSLTTSFSMGICIRKKSVLAWIINDLIKFTLYIFENQEEIKQKWQKRLEYIMIDEFQDIDDLQYQLMCVLCGFHGNLFIVGDPDQTIYTWRGANVKYLLDFHRNFPAVRTYHDDGKLPFHPTDTFCGQFPDL